jgi:hypothetical protein
MLVGALEVALDADHQRSGLPIVAELAAADDAAEVAGEARIGA